MDDMVQMTECVASSISRWHGCKAEYYLLSCSTHSDVRWRDDRRRGPGVYFSEAATNKLVTQALNRGELLAHELRTQARTGCESMSVPQDNPLDTRPQIGTANLTTDTNK